MSLGKLVAKYVKSAEHVIRILRIVQTSPDLQTQNISNVIDSAKAYLRDAKYYREKQKLDVSLVSVAYCEGLLDALRMLGAVDFEWPSETRAEIEEK